MFRWKQHLERLQRSAEFLKIQIPYSADELRAFAEELIARNGLVDCAVRLQLSRGRGPRGYAPSGEEKPFVVMSFHPVPVRELLNETKWKLTVSSFRVAANDALANHKTCSRLLQVCAAMEAHERGADESLIVNTNGEITEGSTSNVFWIEHGTVCTPPLAVGILPGVTRAAILELCDQLSIPRTERNAQPEQLKQMDGVFLTFTTRGVVEAESLDGRPLARSTLTKRLQEALQKLVERECS
jgi:branched-subunit amino acid aminotransferase/4-amino-4-deoxychorismate lyase